MTATAPKKGLDVERGCEIRQNRQLGIWIGMYVDEPGRYYDFRGNEVTLDAARNACFPVDEHLREQEKQAKINEATRRIHEQYGAVAQGEVVATINNLRIEHAGFGRWRVIGPDDDPVHDGTMTRAAAEEFAAAYKV